MQDTGKDGYLLFLQDSDESTGFYFGIVKEATDGSNGHNVHVVHKPASATNTSANSSTNKIDGIVKILKYWFSYIAYYQEDSILNEPILSDYKKEFFDDFIIIDDDANYSPFGYTQQLVLNQLLTHILSNINEIQDQGNKEIVEDIICETITL